MKLRLALLGMVIILIAACAPGGPPYDDQPMDYGFIDTHPQFTAIGMQKVAVQPDAAVCMMGLGVGGVGVIGTVAFPPAGAAAWFVYGSSMAAGFGLGQALGFCYDEFNQYRTAFNVYIQCPVNGPVLQSTFDDYGRATAYVNLYNCRCSFACQMGFEDAPGLMFSFDAFKQGKHYFHAGANRINGPVLEDPSPPDFNAIATSLNIPYAGCDPVGSEQNLC